MRVKKKKSDVDNFVHESLRDSKSQKQVRFLGNRHWFDLLENQKIGSVNRLPVFDEMVILQLNRQANESKVR